MPRAYHRRNTRRDTEHEPPVASLALLLVGVGALCLAVLYPVERVLQAVSAEALVTGAVLIPGPVVATAIGLVLIAATATILGILLLFLRL